MKPNLVPQKPWSQVIFFIHDYLQLVFQDEVFSIYNVSKLVNDGTELTQGTPGFCDAMVNLIEQRVVGISSTTEYPLSLTFNNGSQFVVLGGDLGSRGPEAFQYIN